MRVCTAGGGGGEAGFSPGRGVSSLGRGAVPGAAPSLPAPAQPAVQPAAQLSPVAVLGPPGPWPKATDGPTRLSCGGDWPRGGGPRSSRPCGLPLSLTTPTREWKRDSRPWASQARDYQGHTPSSKGSVNS